MLGAIIGDIIGSIYEGKHLKAKDLEQMSQGNYKLLTKRHCFTDDTVLTIATMDALLNGKSYADAYREYYHRYPKAGYGSAFKKWANSDSKEGYNSYGNGSAMRVSPIAYAFNTLEEVLSEAKKSAEATHDHEEGIKGAQAIASATFLARQDKSFDYIKSYIETTFGYNLDFDHHQLLELFTYEISCQATVPLAIMGYLTGDSYVECVRRTMFYGADTDTLACMTGSMAEFTWGIPIDLMTKAMTKINNDMKMTYINFIKKYSQV
jgi:ADP-ribosylglycohydrolase